MKKVLQKTLFALFILGFLTSTSQSRIHKDQQNREHFLYPRDIDVLHISGIISVQSSGAILRTVERCQELELSHVQQLTCSYYNDLRDSKSSGEQAFWSQDTSLLFFGERHISLDGQFYFANLLPKLKTEGFDTLALEMFNTRDQKYLDQFLDGEINTVEILEVLTRSWNYHPIGYLEILLAAKDLGLQLLAIDNREVTGRLPVHDRLEQADIHMADILTQHFNKSPESKVIVFTGRLHAYQTLSQRNLISTIAEMVKLDRDIQSESFLFFDQKEQSIIPTLAKKIQEKTPSKKVFRLNSISPYAQGVILPPEVITATSEQEKLLIGSYVSCLTSLEAKTLCWPNQDSSTNLNILRDSLE